MQTRCSFSKQAFNELRERFGSSITINKEQQNELDEKGETRLTHSQISDFVDTICSDKKELVHMINDYQSRFHDVAMSLFVINDATWKLMEKKEIASDRMLPMVTIPWFYWRQKAVSPNNPFGVVRDDTIETQISFSSDQKYLVVKGIGGDFNGIVEGRITQHKISSMRIIAPEFPGPKDLVPFYKCEDIEVKLEINNMNLELYPIPHKELDYSFSEHPRVFYQHGLLIETDGKNIVLKIGNKRGSKLKGSIKIFLGRRHNVDSIDHLLYHVWLGALHKVLTQNR